MQVYERTVSGGLRRCFYTNEEDLRGEGWSPVGDKTELVGWPETHLQEWENEDGAQLIGSGSYQVFRYNNNEGWTLSGSWGSENAAFDSEEEAIWSCKHLAHCYPECGWGYADDDGWLTTVIRPNST